MHWTSLSAEFWLRTMAKTLRFECNAAVTADTPMFPVAPTTRTVSIAALGDIGELKTFPEGCRAAYYIAQFDS